MDVEALERHTSACCSLDGCFMSLSTLVIKPINRVYRHDQSQDPADRENHFHP
jgi:hypothetical protein